MSATLEKIRNQMSKVASERNNLTATQTSVRGSGSQASSISLPSSKQPFLSFESKFLDSFHSGESIVHLSNIARYILADVLTCHGVLILKISDDVNSFKIYCRGTIPCDQIESYLLSDFECVQEILSARTAVLNTDDTTKQLHILCQWKPLFTYIPDAVVGVPILKANGTIICVIALAFKSKLPRGFFEKKLPLLKDALDVLIPYALVKQGLVDYRVDVDRMNRVLDAIENVETVSQRSSQTALTLIGTEISNLVGCKNLVMFTVDTGDNSLRKYHTSFGHQGKSSCPNKKVHSMQEISMSDKNAQSLAWVASHCKGLLANSPADFAEYGLNLKHIHSIGKCNCRSLMVVPIVDYSGESALVVEVSDKEKGFTPTEYEAVLLFCQHSACVLTCLVLLDRRDKNHRRRNIINEMLCNITFVKPTNVEQFITYHRKTSNVFRGTFDEFNMGIRTLSEPDIAGIALEVFYELDIVKEFKIRRSVLVRFILSVQQGYGALPYHNWYHAVSVMHFVYLIVKKLKLVETEHLNKLEAFALVVSALTHDIDHRGTNNQFQSYTNSDIYKLYACEDSVMERHHLAIALAILHREDCNILESFNDTDYKYFVELLTWNIIATDISKHLKNRQTLFIEAKSANPKQRRMARLSLFMTAADLCDNCKKWDDNLTTIKGILQEFFNQGDMERQLGFTPIAMMDRELAYVPMIEYKFLKYIVSPVFRFLSEIYPDMTSCVTNIENNEDLWAMSTEVFDKYKDKDQLEILELPELKEDALRKTKLDAQSLQAIKSRKFSISVPLPQSPLPVSTDKKSVLVLSGADDEDLEEVDTGEKRNGRRCGCFCRRN